MKIRPVVSKICLFPVNPVKTFCEIDEKLTFDLNLAMFRASLVNQSEIIIE